MRADYNFDYSSMSDFLISRRSFLRGVYLSMLYASGKIVIPESTIAENTGGRILVGVSTLVSPDQLYGPSFFNHVISHQIFDPLVRVKSDMTIEPCLFRDWEYSECFKEWKFFLQKGVKWHNGKPLKAEQVVRKMSCGLDGCCNRSCQDTGPEKDPDCPYEDDCGTNMAVNKIDDYTIAVRFDKPQPNYLFYLGSASNLMALHDDTRNQLNFIGTGPFKLERIEYNNYAKIKKNSDYWSNKPYLDEIIFQLISKEKALIQLIREGKIDLAPSINLDQVTELDFSYINTSSIPMEAIVLHLNTNKYPFNEVDKRRSFQISMNQDYFNKYVLKGYGTPNSSLIPSNAQHYPGQIKNDKNIDKCKYVKSISNLNVVAPKNLSYVVPYIQEMTKMCGVEVSVEWVDGYDGIREKADSADLIIDQWKRPLWPFGLVENIAASWSKYNLYGFQNKEFDELIRRIPFEKNSKNRKIIANKINQFVMEQAPVVVIGWKPQISVYNKKIRGYYMNQYGHFDGRKIWLQ